MAHDEHGTIAAVLLNYRTPEDTRRAAQALEGDVDHVLVVENGSRDGSADALRTWLPDDAAGEPAEGGYLHVADDRALLVLPGNRGFTGGNNAAVRVARDLWDPDQYLLQNPDARVPGDVLARGRRVAEDRSGVVGFLPDTSDKSLLARIREAGRTPRRSQELEPGLRRVAMAPGMAQILPRHVVDALLEERDGVFRPDLFLFFDELELGWLLEDWDVPRFLVVDDRVEHDVGASTATLDLPLKEYYNTRNIHLVARSMPLANRLLVHPLSLGWALLELAVHVLRRDRPRIRAVADGIRDGLAGRGGQWAPHADAETDAGDPSEDPGSEGSSDPR